MTKKPKNYKKIFEQSPGYGCEFLLTPIAAFTPLRRYAVTPIAVFTLVSGCIGASARKTLSGPQSPSYDENYEVSICRAHGKEEVGQASRGEFKKTRCSPRTRMPTRMLMVRMWKHMDMQSRRALFCNSLFEQSCTNSPVTSLQCGVESVECGV